jgi:hypothetical protein
MTKHTATLIGLIFLLAGCARYDFQITQPTKLAQRITNAQTRINTERLAYDMVAKENRLVVMAYNHGTEPLQLLGDKSFVVDPKGQSHPLRSQTLAPKSYVKLILPPLRPRFEQNPQWNFGIGTQIGSTGHHHHTPMSLDYFADSDSYYWDWDGQVPIRLSLTYGTSDGKNFTDEFTIQKVEAQ